MLCLRTAALRAALGAAFCAARWAAPALAAVPAVAAAAAPPAPAPAAGGLAVGLALGGAAPDATQLASLPDRDGWRALVARDRRVSFLPRSEAEILAALEGGPASAEARAVALVALGAAGVVRERPLVASFAAEGDPLTRCAAILALGELGAGVEAALLRHADESEPTVASCALLALLRTGRERARARVEAIAADAAHPLAETAREHVVFVASPEGSTPTRAAALLLRLRWAAAVRFGLVDGRPFETVLLEELCADEAFLDAVVLRGAAQVRRIGIHDHLLGALLEGTGPARVRAAVRAMPLEVTRLVTSDLWRPTDEEWRAVVDEVADARLEVLAVDLLRLAYGVEAERLRAAALLARVGVREPLRELAPPAADAGARERLLACEAWGISGDRRAVERLAELAADESPRVRAAALVARARLSDGPAAEEVRAIALDVEHETRPAVLEMLLRAGARGGAASLIGDLWPRLEGVERLQLAAKACAAGSLDARRELHAAWRRDGDPGPVDPALVRGLADHALEEDLRILRALFPRGGAREVDVELALGLLANKDRAVLPVLRAALWADDWDRSCLAGALLVELGGPRLLLDEVLGPPASASARDLRRAGFALGEWLGAAGLEDLARARRADGADPALQGALLGFLGTRTRG